MLEIIYNHIIDANLKDKDIVEVLIDSIAKEPGKSNGNQNKQWKNNILNLIMALLLYRLGVDGIKIKNGKEEIGNFTSKNDFKKAGKWKLKSQTLNVAGLEIIFYKYYQDDDSFGDFAKFQSTFVNLNRVKCAPINHNKHNAKDILLGYVFHLDDFVASETAKGLSKLSLAYRGDQRFRLFESIFRNISERAKSAIAKNGLNNKIHVHLAFGHNNGSGLYFFFPETFEEFSSFDELKKIIKEPTTIMKDEKEGLLSKMKAPKRYGPMWAIFTDKEYPDYLKYVTKKSNIWEIEKNVFFEKNKHTSKTNHSDYFMGAIPFISFEEMHLYLYLVGTINSDQDLFILRKVIAFLSYYLFAISESTKESLGIMKGESEKATLKKHYISEGLQGDNLLNLVTEGNGDHKKYVNKLLNSYMLTSKNNNGK